jgi:hypothetical protein
MIRRMEPTTSSRRLRVDELRLIHQMLTTFRTRAEQVAFVYSGHMPSSLAPYEVSYKPPAFD